MRILLFTDSLSLPRSTPEHCTHDKTWPELLRKKGHEVCLSAIGGATIKTIFNQTFYFQDDDYFDMVIIQSGIVDCAPRFARKWEVKLYKNIPLIGKSIIKRLNTKSIRKIRNLTYTSPKEFQYYLNKFSTAFKCPTIFIEILPALSSYEAQLPGIAENINKYNALIGQYPNIAMKNIPPEAVMSDYHHLNAIGHQFVCEQIIKRIESGLS